MTDSVSGPFTSAKFSVAKLPMQRRRALTLLGAAIGGVALAGCSESDAQSSNGGAETSKLMQNRPIEDKIEGNVDAKVTVVEYASMTCPHCANFHIRTYAEIKEKYVDTGKVRFVFREFPLDNLALAAAMLARCAPNDGYFPLTDILFRRQREWSRSDNPRQALFNIAKLAGFTQESFEKCLTDQTLVDAISEVRTQGAEEFGVAATPTLFVNGVKYSGALSVEELSSAIDKLL